jgi:hypothetical protein
LIGTAAGRPGPKCRLRHRPAWVRRRPTASWKSLGAGRFPTALSGRSRNTPLRDVSAGNPKAIANRPSAWISKGRTIRRRRPLYSGGRPAGGSTRAPLAWVLPGELKVDRVVDGGPFQKIVAAARRRYRLPRVSRRDGPHLRRPELGQRFWRDSPARRHGNRLPQSLGAATKTVGCRRVRGEHGRLCETSAGTSPGVAD